MIAVKFQSQNPSNQFSVPSYWIWKKVEIHEDDQATYESNGWTVYTLSEFQAYVTEKKVKLESYYLGQKVGQYNYVDISIEKKKEFSNGLIERLKKKNISEGITAVQALWMHQRLRALPITFMGMTFTIDLMNLVISGDVEIACIALMNTEPDDMSQPYHWFSQDRIDWIVVNLKAFLGWA